jgi:hypothetical protein
MSAGPNRALALSARVSFIECLLRGSAGLVLACVDGAKLLATQAAEPALYQRRRDLVLDFPRAQTAWQQAIEQRLREAAQALRLGRPVDPRPMVGGGVPAVLSLVEDSHIERDIVGVRLGQAVADLTGSEYTDLSARLQVVQGAIDNTPGVVDVLNPSWLGRVVLDAWLQSGLNLGHWATLQTVLNNETAQWTQEAYHHANKLLLDNGVRPEIDLRPFIRRAADTGVPGRSVAGWAGAGAGGGGTGLGGSAGNGVGSAGTPGSPGAMPPGGGGGGGSGGSGGGSGGGVSTGSPSASGTRGNSGLQPLGQSFDETHLLTQTPGLRSPGQSQAVLGKLNQMVARQVPGFAPTSPQPTGTHPVHVSSGLGEAMREAGQVLRRHTDVDVLVGDAPTPALILRDLEDSKRVLKQAAATPVERATIEIVALLFQHILTEERLPATIRVWFARLQMPVLRVAVSEPDFFATTNHPARMLIDRMGSCVMGFAGGGESDAEALHAEIRRVVQVVEAYPDTGRRVFQTVLIEFQKFLETYFRDANEASRKGVSLAQQVEQRETCAIQYTIELRKMLDGVPVHEGVRDFLFRVWADVLAHSAVQSSPGSDETRTLKRAAADLIWSASAKTSREERADVLRRLPPLLKIVRDGMARAGLSVARQDEHVQQLNAALAAAFSARSASISPAHLKAVTDRLDALDEVLPDLAQVDLDEQTLRDLSGHETDELQVVADGGTMPTPAMLAWARELQIGAWFELDYRQRRAPVQLAWQGLQKQLALFVTPSGRGVLFQLRRLAAFLQAGLLVPVEEESLTTRATREALAKLDADPERLLN